MAQFKHDIENGERWHKLAKNDLSYWYVHSDGFLSGTSLRKLMVSGILRRGSGYMLQNAGISFTDGSGTGLTQSSAIMATGWKRLLRSGTISM